MRKLIAFGWYGGKYSHLNWLLPLLPMTTHYCEPFGGSAAVLINRPPSPVETYNDIDGEIVNFFRVLREQKEALIEAIGLTPFSREEFETAISEPKERLSDLERARRFYILARQVRTGLAQKASSGRWAHCKLTSRAGMAGAVSRWLGAVEDLPLIAQRLLRVQIENAPAIEVIKRYDSEETLFYCLAPGSLMRTADERMVPIEQINVGEYLYGGRHVKQTLRKEWTGQILTLTVQGLPDLLDVTSDHPILRIPRRRSPRQEKRTKNVLWSQREVVRADQLELGDYLLVPLGGAEAQVEWDWRDESRKHGLRRQDLEFKPSPALFRFLGYYAAEGHIQRSCGHPTMVVLSFGIKETETWVADATQACRTTFGITPAICPASPHPTVTQLRIHSSTIAEFVQRWVVGTATTKALHQALLTAPMNLQRELLIGWLRGDSGIEFSSRNRVKLVGTSASEALARQIFLIALRCSLRPSFKRRAHACDIYFASEDAMALGWEVPCSHFRSTRKIINGHMLARVRNVRARLYTGFVYDLDVDRDNLFAAPFALVHNCDPPYPHDSRGDANAYANEMTDDQHRELAEVLHNVKGKVALSGYHCDLMDQFYGGWRQVESPEKICHSVKTPRTEVLWTNYNLKGKFDCQPRPRHRQGHQQISLT